MSECEIEGWPASIPEGRYTLRFHGWETCLLFGRNPKVCLNLSVADLGEYFGTKVQRWYNVRRLKGRPRKNGQFVASWGSDLVAEYMYLRDAVRRTDRISLGFYRDCLLIGEIETVRIDRRQHAREGLMQYSIVRKLTGLEYGPGKIPLRPIPAPAPVPVPTRDTCESKAGQ